MKVRAVRALGRLRVAGEGDAAAEAGDVGWGVHRIDRFEPPVDRRRATGAANDETDDRCATEEAPHRAPRRENPNAAPRGTSAGLAVSNVVFVDSKVK